MPKPKNARQTPVERRAERRAEALVDGSARARASIKDRKRWRGIDLALVEARKEAMARGPVEMEIKVVDRTSVERAAIEQEMRRIASLRVKAEPIRVARIVKGRRFRIRREPDRLRIFDSEGFEYAVLIGFAPRVEAADVGQRLAFIAVMKDEFGRTRAAMGRPMMERVVGEVVAREEFFVAPDPPPPRRTRMANGWMVVDEAVDRLDFSKAEGPQRWARPEEEPVEGRKIDL